jgi:serine/threonine protein kinase
LRTSKETARVRDEVRGLLAADRAAGDVKAPAHYEGMFPGYETVVRDAWEAADTLHTRLEGAPLPDREPRPEVERVGPYRVLREIARGGMGLVFLAEDTRTGRKLALKVLPAAYAAFPTLAARFRREAEVASRLDHPAICTVYEAGEADGVAYIAMRYVEGETLGECILRSRREVALTGRGPGCVTGIPGPGPATTDREAILRVVGFVEKVARALHAAHEAGLVHRDVKPGNVMVTRDGEPVLLDFGLARVEAGEGDTLTGTGAVIGTPAYMSPEQVSGQKAPLDRRSDIFSLGALLYQCLTLTLPFEAGTAVALYQKILGTDPESPRHLNPALTEDLRVVVETAMAKDRARRYQTALDLAEDLRRVRANEPIRARRAGLPERLFRWTQRNPVPTLAFLGVALVLVAGRVFTGIILRDTEDALAAARAEVAALGRSETAARANEKILWAIAEKAQENAALEEDVVAALEALFDQQQARGDGPGAEGTARRILGLDGMTSASFRALRERAEKYLSPRKP